MYKNKKKNKRLKNSSEEILHRCAYKQWEQKVITIFLPGGCILQSCSSDPSWQYSRPSQRTLAGTHVPSLHWNSTGLHAGEFPILLILTKKCTTEHILQ